MTSIQNFALLLFRNIRAFAIAIDCALNVVVCTIGLQEAFAAETLSAHAWRVYRDGKPWGRAVMPVIDWMFSWQAIDYAFRDETGEPVKGHCRRAYMREKARYYLPAEYGDNSTDAKGTAP